MPRRKRRKKWKKGAGIPRPRGFEEARERPLHSRQDGESQLKALDDLDKQAWELQRQVGSVNAIQDRVTSSVDKLNKACMSARELNKQTSSVKNPEEMTANLGKRLGAVKQYADSDVHRLRTRRSGRSMRAGSTKKVLNPIKAASNRPISIRRNSSSPMRSRN